MGADHQKDQTMNLQPHHPHLLEESCDTENGFAWSKKLHTSGVKVSMVVV